MKGSAETFLNSALAGNIQSAYLLICNRPGVSAKLTNTFLMRLLCSNGGCGVCPECRRVLEGHIDIMRLSAPKVAAIREIISFVAEKPSVMYKAVVIENADDITPSAANSLLKTLEQPPQNTIFILQARSDAGVLPTVLSRCSAVHIAPDSDAQSHIERELKVDSSTAHILCDLSGGFLEEAKTIYADSDFWNARPLMLDICHKLLYQKGMAISSMSDFLETHKEKLGALLCVMQSFFRDILIYKKTKDSRLLINTDREAEIISASSDFTSGAISNIINSIFETERRFFFSVNFKLAVEKLFFDILEEKARWKKL